MAKEILSRKSEKPDKEPDRAVDVRIKISQKKFDIYLLLTKGFMAQSKVAKELNIRRQSVNEHVKDLEILGLIEPIDPNGNPKFYKPTNITPVVSGSTTPVVSGFARKMERSVRKTPILVRDRKTGKIKGWKSGRKVGNIRNYDTIVSTDGKRITMLRMHSIAYTCTILREPLKEVPWSIVDGMKGMQQYIFKKKFSNKSSALFNLRTLEVTFLRQKTAGSDELIIYMPEKYFFKYELDQGEKILKEYVWKARKWFQNEFKAWLSLTLPYRDMEIAREIFDPMLRKCVKENGMVKVKTKRGRGIVDESKKGFPEREYTSTEQVKADLEAPDRILDLEGQMQFLMDQQKQLMESQHKMTESIRELTDDISEFMGFRRKMEAHLEEENKRIYA